MMSLFNQVLNALNDPKEDATPGQMAVLLDTVRQVSNSYGTNPSTVQSILSIVGNHARSALQQKRTSQGQQQAEEVVDRYSGVYPNPQSVNALFSGSQVQAIVQEVANRTGMNAQTIQSMLPILVPLVLNFLKTGSRSQANQGGNPVLSAFLDADNDGDVDIADAIALAGRHLAR